MSVKVLRTVFTSLFIILTLLFFVPPSFAASASKEVFYQAKVSWKSVPNTTAYNIYYRESNQKQYTHAARNLPASVTSYTIGFLKKGRTYYYAVAAIDASAKQIWLSNPQRLITTLMR